MNTSEYLRTGDAVTLTVTIPAYPYVLSYDVDGNLVSNLSLQGRVLYADALGVCISTTGGLIMPSSNPDHDLMPMPDAEHDRGEFFPWRSIERVNLLARSVAYDAAWLAKFAEEEVYAEDHDGAYPSTQREFVMWAQTQEIAALTKRVRGILKRDAEAGE